MLVTDKLIQILQFINNDGWLNASKSPELAELTDSKGQKYKFPKSYYRQISGFGTIRVRVSEHGTHLNTWVKPEHGDPTQSLQNLSIVLADGVPEYSLETDPRPVPDGNGGEKLIHLYFVVEQYAYSLRQISLSDFKKILNYLKRLGDTANQDNPGVFIDPLGKKKSKRANRKVLIPTDRQGNEIPMPSDPNALNFRQRAVASDKDHEFDKEGNPIVDWRIRKGTLYSESRKIIRLTENQFRRLIVESVEKILREIA